MVTVLMNPQPQKEGDYYAETETWETAADLRWVLTVWPMQRESWFARAVPGFAGNLDWWEAAWSNRTLLEPLLDPDVPLRPMALLMLALGLAAKEPGESGLATDALIAAIDDGRLDAGKLGDGAGIPDALDQVCPIDAHPGPGRTRRAAAHAGSRASDPGLPARRAGPGDPRPAGAPGAAQGKPHGARRKCQRCRSPRLSGEDQDWWQKHRLARELLTLEAKPAPLLRRKVCFARCERRIDRAESWSRGVE